MWVWCGVHVHDAVQRGRRGDDEGQHRGVGRVGWDRWRFADAVAS